MERWTIRGMITDVNWIRVLTVVCVLVVAGITTADPAFAFAGLANSITSKAGQVATALRAILFAMAVVSVLAGAAPMLWGEVRVKWMVSALAACAVIASMGSLVDAFTGGGGSAVLGDVGG